MASLSGLRADFRRAARILLLVAADNGIHLTITSTRRSRAKQKRLYQKFLRGEMPYTVLPPGTSLHERGIAIDVWTKSTPQLHALGEWWRSVGGTWGGAGDPVHFGAPRSWW